MNKKLHHIDRLFKTALGNEKEPPTPKIWDAVRNTLVQKQAARIQKKYNRLKQKFMALLLLCTLTGGYTLYHYATTHQSNALSDATLKKPAPQSAKEHARRTKNGAAQPEAAVATVIKHKEVNNFTKHTLTETHNRPNVPDQPIVFKKERHSKRQTITAGRMVKRNFFKNPYHSEANGNNALVQTEHGLTNEHLTGWTHYPKGLFEPRASGIVQANKILLPIKLEGILMSPVTIKQTYKSTATKRKQASPFSLTLFYASDFAMDPLDDTDEDDVSRPGDANMDRREQYASSYNAGLVLDYGISKNWSLQTGIAFSNFSTIIEPKTIYAQANDQGAITYKLRCAAGNSYIALKTMGPAGAGDSAQSSGSQTVLQYITVPVSVKYGVQKGKLRFITGLGLSANFLIEGKVNTNIQYGSDDETYENDISGLKPVYLNGLVNLGAEYRVTKKLWLSLMPTGRIALGSINKDIPVRSYQDFLSVAVGLRITF